MLKYYFLAAMFLISSSGYSKSRHRSNFHIEGFAIKADALSLFHSVITKGEKSCYLSGEIYFNNKYSFNIDLATATETDPAWNNTEKRIGGNFRWYFMQDDCNCSALFAGSYLHFVNIRQSVDQNLLPHASGYNISFLEGGIAGGFQTILRMHFL